MYIYLCEMYPSFDGEVNVFGQGVPSIFIRFQGCNLECKWCDTKYARDVDSTTMMVTPNWVVDMAQGFSGINKVTVTGGEPLLQANNLKILVKELFFYGYKITIETNGSHAWDMIGDLKKYWVHSWLIDYKLSGSGQRKFMQAPEYFGEYARVNDFIKFVIDIPEDFEEAIELQAQMIDLGCRARFAYSTTNRKVKHAELAKWMQENPWILDKAVLNVQLHKVVWPNERSR